MFGLSWDQIILILLAALFLLGPERIPVAARWLVESLRKLRTFAAGAQDELRAQLGTELDEMRQQIAELQSLKELKELRELRELDPRRVIGKSLLGDEFSSGMTGFLGLTGASTGTDRPPAQAAPPRLEPAEAPPPPIGAADAPADTPAPEAAAAAAPTAAAADVLESAPRQERGPAADGDVPAAPRSRVVFDDEST